MSLLADAIYADDRLGSAPSDALLRDVSDLRVERANRADAWISIQPRIRPGRLRRGEAP